VEYGFYSEIELISLWHGVPVKPFQFATEDIANQNSFYLFCIFLLIALSCIFGSFDVFSNTMHFELFLVCLCLLLLP